MAGRADPAFLNNVPTAVTTGSSSSIAIPFSSATSSTTLVSSTIASITATFQAPAATSTPVSSDGNSSIYFYTPSTVLAIIFSVLYGILIPYHFYLSIYIPRIRKSVPQKHGYTIPLFITCALSTLGYSLRIASSSPGNRSSVTLYAMSQTYIIIAPIFACATLYLMLAYLINLCLPAGQDRIFLRISPRWLGRIFITSDVLSFLMQCAGSGIAASGNWDGTQKEIGTNVLIAGLVAQLVTFTLFMFILALFCRRVHAGHERKEEGQIPMSTESSGAAPGATSRRAFGFNPLVKQVIRGVWIASLFIEVRSIFRTIEFGLGVDGYPFRHEWMLWVFDAAPIWIALLVLGFYHPIRWLQSKRRSFFVDKKTIVINNTQQNE